MTLSPVTVQVRYWQERLRTLTGSMGSLSFSTPRAARRCGIVPVSLVIQLPQAMPRCVISSDRFGFQKRKEPGSCIFKRWVWPVIADALDDRHLLRLA